MNKMFSRTIHILLVCLMSADLLLSSTLLAQDLPHHNLKVTLSPQKESLKVNDELNLPKELIGKSLNFRLASTLEILDVEGASYRLLKEDSQKTADKSLSEEEFGKASTNKYELIAKSAIVKISYRGRISNELQSEGQEYSRSFQRSAGIIGTEGVVLAGSSCWLPRVAELCTFSMHVSCPLEWSALSQGERQEVESTSQHSQVIWACDRPCEEIYLIANKFTLYESQAGSVKAYAYLRTKDDKLANQYLEVTAQYIEMYRGLLGNYPYKKFALVENFWETGYGMPSFTLLGSSVIRLPFILHSSYPHEILHNWWGNSVYVDFESGNWCEGLTAYLADHLIQEGRGRGQSYRRSSLKKYVNYVKGGKDFALKEFRSRHSAATEAVGYGKSLMLFHMLRRKCGDSKFALGMQRFYREFKYKRASFDDIQEVFSKLMEQDLKPWFSQWVDRVGAPELQISANKGPARSVLVELKQVQSEAAYSLDVPVRFAYADGSTESSVFSMNSKSQLFQYVSKSKSPLVLVQADPDFDLFRRLDRNEIPASAGEVFGASKSYLIYASQNHKDVEPADWKKLADGWAQGQTGEDGEASVVVMSDSAVKQLPSDGAIWLLGTNNKFAMQLSSTLLGLGFGLQREKLLFGKEERSQQSHSFLFALRRETESAQPIGWIGSDLASAIPGLARKLPHYGKYSYLAFEGDEPSNVVKGQWSTRQSPLLVAFSSTADSLAFEKRSALAELRPALDSKALMKHVLFLADDELEGRGAASSGLALSAAYIENEFKTAGLKPAGDEGSYFQEFLLPEGPNGHPELMHNIVAYIPGHKKEFDGQYVLVGAHYDHLGRGWPDVREKEKGLIFNGADDNASGIAVMIEVAKLLADYEPDRTLVFVAFSGEECGLVGSRYFADNCANPLSNCLGMINLDTVGRLGNQKLTVFGAGSASEWIHIARGIGFTTGIESQVISQDPGGSDQIAFHEKGVPAIQLFTGAHKDYHHASDEIDQVDAGGMVKVALWLRECLGYMASREGFLSSNLGSGQQSQKKAVRPKGEGRRVSLGTLPNFSDQGPGVLVDEVMADSPALAAGILKGDRLMEIDGQKLANLRAYSDLLKKCKVGQKISIQLIREGKTVELEATLIAR